MLRIPHKDLVIDDEDGRYWLNDVLFTGIAFLSYPDGRTRKEQLVREGRQEGFAKTWYPDGGLEAERSVLGGRRHGRTREWHRNGRLRREAMYEFGIQISATDWDADGQVTGTFRIDPNSENYAMLIRLRSIQWDDPAVQRLLLDSQCD
jgi:hypothetical protein